MTLLVTAIPAPSVVRLPAWISPTARLISSKVEYLRSVVISNAPTKEALNTKTVVETTMKFNRV